MHIPHELGHGFSTVTGVIEHVIDEVLVAEGPHLSGLTDASEI